mmetsp:Transcript_14912/g.29987  ORF Transcript_14912/g.29987 Transcript_14912/m.29987 type:complete len:92 (+) Transcript_14912:372-647(+)
MTFTMGKLEQAKKDMSQDDADGEIKERVRQLARELCVIMRLFAIDIEEKDSQVPHSTRLKMATPGYSQHIFCESCPFEAGIAHAAHLNALL